MNSFISSYIFEFLVIAITKSKKKDDSLCYAPLCHYCLVAAQQWLILIFGHSGYSSYVQSVTTCNTYNTSLLLSWADHHYRFSPSLRRIYDILTSRAHITFVMLYMFDCQYPNSTTTVTQSQLDLGWMKSWLCIHYHPMGNSKGKALIEGPPN